MVKYSHPEHERTRSQDLEPIYHDCGQFYICRVDKFKERHSLIIENIIPLIMPEEEVQDIDTLSDWKLAEIKYTLMREAKRA
jgi:N-acylneuraminate cytidylyltransferase